LRESDNSTFFICVAKLDFEFIVPAKGTFISITGRCAFAGDRDREDINAPASSLYQLPKIGVYDFEKTMKAKDTNIVEKSLCLRGSVLKPLYTPGVFLQPRISVVESHPNLDFLI
jgi:hypothetical protein